MKKQTPSQYRFELAIQKINDFNQQDPRKEVLDGKSYPNEVLYSIRMSKCLMQLAPDASEEIQLAARGQHIGRWMIARKEYPMNIKGYNNWRRALRKFHSETVGGILTEVGYEEESIQRVQFLIEKRQLKRDPESQMLEDVVCLVFLEFYLNSFTEKYKDDKLIDILSKTWQKMSTKGKEAAQKLSLSKRSRELIARAIKTD